MTLPACVYVCVLRWRVQSSVVPPDRQRFKASTAPSRFGWALHILVKDGQCIKDFIQKMARQRYFWVILKATRTATVFPATNYSAVHWHLSALHDSCRDPPHKHKMTQNISLKNTRKAGRPSSVTVSRNLSVCSIDDAFRNNFESVRHLRHMNCRATKDSVFQRRKRK